jgi:hypothetical protein
MVQLTALGCLMVYALASSAAEGMLFPLNFFFNGFTFNLATTQITGHRGV